jgi:hypothetical protein
MLTLLRILARLGGNTRRRHAGSAEVAEVFADQRRLADEAEQAEAACIEATLAALIAR